MILLPPNLQWKQNNQSNVLGNIWSSFNLDLSSNLGRLRISPRLLVQTTTDEDMTTAPCAFRFYSSKFWTISGTKVHSNSGVLESDFSADATAGFPTNCRFDYSDMELFNGWLYVTTDSNSIYKYNGSAWANYAIGASSVGPHMLTVYAGKLYYTTLVNTIRPLTAAGTFADADTIGTAFTLGAASDVISNITWLRSASNRIWIGTLSERVGKSFIYEWDGVSTQATRSYRIEAQGALACVIKDDIPWVMDYKGKLLVFNGATFKEVARLPIENIYLKNAVDPRNTRFIHPNGMSVIDGKINLLINNENEDNGATINENLPSGIWEYDENIGLYHKHSLSYYNDFSGAITDYGQNRISVAGALSELKFVNKASNANGTLMAGELYFTDATATQARVFIDDRNDTIQKSGYFVTSWIDSQNVQDIWQSIITTYRQLLDSADKIILKYRTTEADPTEISITWVDTDTFTTATDVSGKVGYEVEIVQGTGSGKTAHISSVTGASPYTVNLDDTFTGVTTGTAKARLQAWTKLGEITGQTQEWSKFPIGKKSPRIQVKCCIISTGKNEIHRLALINQPHQLLT